MREGPAVAWPGRAVKTALLALTLGAAFAGAQASNDNEALDAEESPDDDAQTIGIERGISLGGAGVSGGDSGGQDPLVRPKLSARGVFSNAVVDGAAGAAPSGCVVEDLNWCPGGGGPQVSLPNQAMRSQAEGTIMAYRISWDKLGPYGHFEIYDMALAEIGLSNKPCDARQLDAVEDRHCQRRTLGGWLNYYDEADKKLSAAIRASGYAYSYCPLPKPLDKHDGQGVLYLNVRVPKSCDGGSTWFCGDHSHPLQSSDPDLNNSRCVLDKGYCGRAILYETRGPGTRVCNNYSKDGSANGLPAVVGCQDHLSYFARPSRDACNSLNIRPAWRLGSQTCTHYWQGGASCVDCPGYLASHPDWDRCVTWVTTCCPP